MCSPRKSRRLAIRNCEHENTIFMDENFDYSVPSDPDNDTKFICELFPELKDVNSKSSNVKSYCNKRKVHGTFFNETFGLPDTPIFSNKPIKREIISETSQLDAYITNPSELSVLDLTYIDQPWLVANPEVITHHPSLDVLIPFEEIRVKQSAIMHKFGRNRRYSADSVDAREEHNCVFTSTPFKCRTSNISVISTISLTKNENKTGISALTSSLEKILTDAIKSESNIDKIDMKIKVITSPIPKTETFSKLEVFDDNYIELSPTCQVEPPDYKMNVKPKTKQNFSRATNTSRILRSHSQESKKGCAETQTSTRKYQSKAQPASLMSELLQPSSFMQGNKNMLHLSRQSSLAASEGKFKQDLGNPGHRSSDRSFNTQDTSQLLSVWDNSVSENKFPSKRTKSKKARSLLDIVDRNANFSRSLRLAGQCSTSASMDTYLLKENSFSRRPCHNVELLQKDIKPNTSTAFLETSLSRVEVIYNHTKEGASDVSSLPVNQMEYADKNRGFPNKLVANSFISIDQTSTLTKKRAKNIEPCSNPKFVNRQESTTNNLDSCNIKLQNTGPLRRSFRSPKYPNKEIDFVMRSSNKTTLNNLEVQTESNSSETMHVSAYSVETENLKLKPMGKHVLSARQPLPAMNCRFDGKEYSELKATLTQRPKRLKSRSRRKNCQHSEIEFEKHIENTAVINKGNAESSDYEFATLMEKKKHVKKNQRLNDSVLSRSSPTVVSKQTDPDIISNSKDLNVLSNQTLKNIKDQIVSAKFTTGGPVLIAKANLKKEETNLRENGIVSQIKIVISPIDMQDTNRKRLATKSCIKLKTHIAETVVKEEVSTPKEDVIVLHTTGTDGSSGSSSNDLSSLSLKGQTITHRGTSIKRCSSPDFVKDHKYKNGSLVWAQLGKYPYWPALICKDPVMRVYQMGGTENTPGKTRYHIRFFNDSGRRAWIPHSHLLPYRNSNDLDSLVHGAKRAESIKFRIRPNHLHKWKIAIDQIEFYKNKTFRQVHSFLVNSSAKKKQMKQLLEKGTDTKVDFPQTPDKHLDIKFKIDERSATEEPVENRDVRVSVSTDRSVGNVQDLSAQHADAGEAEMPPGKFIEEAPIKNEGRKSVLINVKSENSDLGLKNRAVRSEDPNKYSFEYQTDLHRKNNLFNGLTKVKVCNYCLKEGAIYKCKGQCREYFHNACAAKVTEPRPQRGRKRKIYDESQGNIKPSRVINTMPHKRITRDQVEIVTVKSRVRIASPKKTVPSNFDEMSLGDRIDYQMKAMMSPFENQVMYMDSSTDSSSEEGSVQVPLNINFQTRTPRKTNELPNMFDHDRDDSNVADPSILSEEIDPKTKRIKHVTADSVIEDVDASMFKCGFCKANRDPPCFICGLETSKRGITRRQKCTLHRCGKYYHTRCLKMWPQTQWSFSKWSRDQKNEDSFTCPAHICHTCFSEELGGGCSSRFPVDKLARCLRCPAAFHTSSFCIPAGTEIVGGNQIVCPRHRNGCQPLNTTWCFICSEGGNLVCCDMCPTSVHPECQPIHFTDDDKYICEDCESGRFPLYDEIMWVKLGSYPWWPALILFPNEVPENVRILKHQRGDFVVRFFGTYDHYWVSKARSFLFQEGDQGASPGQVIRSRKPAYETFEKAIQDAAIVYKLKKEFKLRREAEGIGSLKPPPYIKISKNKPVGNVRVSDMDLSNTTACECDPNSIYPCGPDSYCINRLLMTECDPDICPAASRCMNQSFEKREYTPLVPYKTQGRGWGLKCLKAIKKGQFIIEYVGELIDGEEYQRRIKKMHEQKEENYYFMTIDNDRIIDAGPKGNLSRFMNHSCNPNCETQKWTVKGDTRVGLFAIQDVDIGSELTFNYNLECVGQERKLCQCGALNCSGFIGIKAKPDPVATENNIRKSNRKKTESPIPVLPACFICGKDKSDLACRHKSCDKAYHLDCLDLTNRTEGSRFICPRHNCNMCAKRTMRFCVKCINSYCPSHSDGNVRYDKLLGFICKFHDPKKVISEAATTKKTPKLPRTKRFKNSPNDPEAQARRAVSKLPEKNRRGVAS